MVLGSLSTSGLVDDDDDGVMAYQLLRLILHLLSLTINDTAANERPNDSVRYESRTLQFE